MEGRASSGRAICWDTLMTVHPPEVHEANAVAEGYVQDVRYGNARITMTCWVACRALVICRQLLCYVERYY